MPETVALNSNVFYFKPKAKPSEVGSSIQEENFSLLLEKSRRVSIVDNWDSIVWDISNLDKKTTSVSCKKRLHFGIPSESRGEYSHFNLAYSDLVKSILTVKYIESGVGHGPLHTMLIAFRYLYLSLDDSSSWKDICLDNFLKASNLMAQRGSPSTCYRIAGALSQVAKYLNRFGLVSLPVEYISPFKRQSNTDPLSQRFVDRKSKLFLKQDVIEAIIKLDKMSLPDNERLVVLILKLFLFTGFRLSELLGLKANGLVEKVENGERFIGIRYYPLKGGHKVTQIKWFGDLSGELVKEIFGEIFRLTSENRKIGKWNKNNPGLSYLRKLTDKESLTLKELSDLTERSESSLCRTISKLGFKSPYRITDLDNVFSQKEVTIFEDRSTNYLVDISNALIVVPYNFFSHHKVSSKLIVRGVTSSMLENMIKTKGSDKGIFDRYDLMDSNQEPLKVNTHMFRRFLNTLYNEGGVPLTVLTKIFGRKNKKDTLAYLYTSAEERTKQIKEKFKNGAMIGPKVDMIQQIEVKDRDSYIDTVTNSVHYLGHGYCSHDWSTLPCEKQLNCLDKCVDFHVEKNDPNSINYLKQQKEWASKSLNQALEELKDETYGSQAHVEHYKRILENVEKYLKGIE